MEDYTAEMIKDMAFSFCPQCGTAIIPSKAGELEDRAVEDLPGVRQGVFLPAPVRVGTEILQPGLCQPGQRKGGKRCSR